MLEAALSDQSGAIFLLANMKPGAFAAVVTVTHSSCDLWFFQMGSVTLNTRKKIKRERSGDFTTHLFCDIGGQLSRRPSHLCDSNTQKSLLRPRLPAGLYYLYHDVDILYIPQHTEVGIKVKPVVLAVGVRQDHLTLPQGLEEDLLPLRPLIHQQLPLEGQHN